MTTKKMINGTATPNTSKGIFTIHSPLNENITTIANNRAISGKGLITGMNF